MRVVGMLLIAFGVCAGLYVGVWWAFIGGIVEFIEAVKATPVESKGIAIGIAKVLFAGPIGWFVGLIFVFFGMGAYDK